MKKVDLNFHTESCEYPEHENLQDYLNDELFDVDQDLTESDGDKKSRLLLDEDSISLSSPILGGKKDKNSDN